MSVVARRNIFTRLADIAVDRPWRTLLAGIALFAVLMPGLARVHQNVSYRVWFKKDDPHLQTLDRFEKRFGSDVSSLIIVHSPSGIFDKESAQLLIDLTDRMWKVAATMRVESLANFPWVHPEADEIIVENLIPDDKELTDELLAERKKVALNHEQLPGFLVSRDGKTAVIYGWLEPKITDADADYFANVKELRKLVEEFKGRGDNELRIAGFPSMENYMVEVPPRENQRLMPLITVFCMALFLVMFRRLTAAVLPLLPLVPSLMATIAVAGWLGYDMDPMTLAAPNILLCIGMSAATHPLFLYYRALNNGISRREAARHALASTLGPDFFSCLTIAIGFLSLVTMSFPPVQHMGIIVAAGTVMVWLLVCMILGPLMVLLPIKSKRMKAGGKQRTLEELEIPNRMAERVTGFIDRYKVAIIVGWFALAGFSLWVASRNAVSWEPEKLYGPGSEVRRGNDFIKEHLGSSEGFEIVIDSGKQEGIKDPAFLRKVDQLEQWIAAQKKVVKVISLVDILKDTNRALLGGGDDKYRLPDSQRAVADEYFLYTMNLPLGKSLNDRVTMTNDALRMTVLSRLENSPAVLALEKEIGAKASELGLKTTITGRALLTHELNPYFVSSLGWSLISSIVPMSLLMMLFFRSFRLGLLSMIPNLLPLAVGAGVIFALLGKSFDMASVTVFTIALGIAVDDTVHFLAGYGELRREGIAPREAIARLWMTVGPAMVIATLVLATCFSVFLLATFPILEDMGVLIASMLVIAVCCDLLLSPAMLLLLDNKRFGLDRKWSLGRREKRDDDAG